MFPSDSQSVRQLHAADIHVAQQRRTRGKVVPPQERRWHQALLAKLTIQRDESTRPVTTAYARAQRRKVFPTVSFNLIDASAAQRLLD